MPFTVLITDRHLEDISLERAVLDPLGVRIIDPGFNRHTSEQVVLDLVRTVNPDAMMSTYVPMTRNLMMAAPACKVVVRYAVGYDTIDVVAATELGVIAANVPDYGTVEVADHALTLLLASARRIIPYDRALRAPQWGYKSGQPIGRISGRTLGIIGLGRIGSAVAQRAVAFGLKVVAYDPYIAPERFAAVGAISQTLDQVLASADYLTLHVPLTEETRGLIGPEAFGRMKPGVIFVNTCRGEVVDQAALYAALLSGHVAGAGLDVFDTEPVPTTEPLLALPNVIMTPHVAWYSEESVVGKVRGTAQAVAAVIQGGWPVGFLNPAICGRSRAERARL